MDKDMMNSMKERQSRGFWWSKGRQAIVRRIIEWMRLPDDAQILEIGCGYGGNLRKR